MVNLRLLGRKQPAPEPAETGPIPLAELEPALIECLAKGDKGVTELVDLAMRQAVHHRASDIHFEPWPDCMAVRFRIDGILQDVGTLPREHQEKIIARIKVMGRMVAYKKDKPQDGRIDPENSPSRKGMRISTFPTVNGEKAVVRILAGANDMLELDTLGFDKGVVQGLRAAIERSQGTLLLTGPSSSGKTTTIYALLREIIANRKPSPHVVTIEDPVEYRLSKVAQTQVDPHSGFTFDAALRAILRQDPEVIMLGEIRDPETAKIAIQAGLTGHLVISTIHSGTAAGVFTRLLDMGIEPYLVASSVTGVLAQRLLRVNCPHCSVESAPDDSIAGQFGFDEGTTIKTGQGCEQCQGLGYRGRTAVGELLSVDEELAELALARSRTKVLHEAALCNGMTPLADAAAAKVKQGITSIEELRRVLNRPVNEGSA